MLKLLRYFFLLLIVLLIDKKTTGQIQFQIKPNVTEIGKEDVLQVEYKVSGATDASNFVQPNFIKWKVLSGPSYSSQEISVNGRTESSISYVFSLQPKSAGTLQLPATTVEVDEKKINCSAINITVKNTAHVAGANASSNSLQLPGGFFQEDVLGEDEIDKASVLHPGETFASKIKDNIFVKVTANKTSCVVGEPILITYELFTRLRSQSKIAKQPAFSGCTVYEMTTEDQFPQIITLKGKEYKTYVIRKVQLFPLQTGDLKLDIASVENEITLFKKNSYGDAIPITQTVTLSNEPLTIHVNALPEKNKPADSNGTIGEFSITAKTNKIIDTADDNNMLEINISGSGNFQSINCPKINWPNNTEHFDNTEKSDINKMIFPASGTKTFLIPFVAKQAGTVIMPPIEFSYLDINSKQYKTILSDSIVIKVLPALKNKYEINKISQDITNHKYIWIVPAIALLAGISWWFGFGRKKQTEQKPNEIINAEVKTETVAVVAETEKFPEPTVLTNAEKLNELLLIETDKKFFAHAKQLAEEFMQKEVSAEKRKLFAQVIEQCNEALYSPVAIISKESVFISLEKLV
ncbi:MAG TPA: BatD family protein [Chitinophagaceae bacterium]|nr:BatD family protein [Chitinophagaceae bacterium]